MSDTDTFAKRIEIGRECEARFRSYCESIDLTIIETTQHLADQVKEHARHFPDFYIIERSMFIQVKDASHSEKWPDVIVEKKSFDACAYLAKYTPNVAIVWEFPSGDWMGEKFTAISPSGEISDDARTHGSGTPAYKIRKSSLAKFK